jgi:hypothetical protein
MHNPTTPKPARIPDHLQTWITARNRHRLSHAHVQMARALAQTRWCEQRDATTWNESKGSACLVER